VGEVSSASEDFATFIKLLKEGAEKRLKAYQKFRTTDDLLKALGTGEQLNPLFRS